MSLWSRTLVYLGLREEPDDAAQWAVIEDAELIEDVVVTPPSGSATLRSDAAAARPATATASTAPSVVEPAAPAEGSNVRSLHGGAEPAGGRVSVVQVRVFEDVEAVGSRHRHRHPVLFDVTACTREVARRTVDFVSGLTYASEGTLRRIAPRVFLLVPEGVDVPLEERRRLAQLGYDVDGRSEGTS